MTMKRIFHSFPKLLHRRTKSDETPAVTIAPTLPHRPHSISGYPAGCAESSINCRILELELHLLNKIIADKEKGLNELRLALSDLRDDLYATLDENGRPRLAPKAIKAAADIKELEEKIRQYDQALGLMVNDSLESTVLAKASIAASKSEDPEDAVVTAIRAEASFDLEGSYARLIPSVTGTRDEDVQAAASRMVTKLRTDLDARKKIIRFWKRLAQDSDDKNLDVITPSSSCISSIHEDLPKERENVATSLRACLRAERSAAMRLKGVASPELCTDDDDDDTETVKSFTSTSTVRPTVVSTQSISNSDPRELDTVNEVNEMTKTPASQTTIEQSKKRNRDKWAYRARPVLESLDVNALPNSKNGELLTRSADSSHVASIVPKDYSPLNKIPRQRTPGRIVGKENETTPRSNIKNTVPSAWKARRSSNAKSSVIDIFSPVKPASPTTAKTTPSKASKLPVLKTLQHLSSPKPTLASFGYRTPSPPTPTPTRIRKVTTPVKKSTSASPTRLPTLRGNTPTLGKKSGVHGVLM